MTTSVHLVFAGNCSEAFDFYEQVFNTRRIFTMTYGEAPDQAALPSGMKDAVLHTTLPLGTIKLLGCDAPPDRRAPFGGFQISVAMEEEAEVRRIYAALSQGGSIQMPLDKTFWSPLFGMCTDRFGVAWMVSVLGDSMPQS